MTVDMTFCGSPNCTNKCGRQMKPEQRAFLEKYPSKPVYYSYFCGDRNEMPRDIIEGTVLRFEDSKQGH